MLYIGFASDEYLPILRLLIYKEQPSAVLFSREEDIVLSCLFSRVNYRDMCFVQHLA